MVKENIEVFVSLEKQDYHKFTKFMSRKILIAFYTWMFMMGLYMLNIQGWLGLLITAACCMGMVLFNHLITNQRFDNNKILKKDKLYYFSENNIEFHTVDGSNNGYIEWDELYSVDKTKELLILQVEQYDGIIIPLRCIKKEKVTELETLIKMKLGSKAFSKKRLWKVAIISALLALLFIICIDCTNSVSD